MKTLALLLIVVTLTSCNTVKPERLKPTCNVTTSVISRVVLPKEEIPVFCESIGAGKNREACALFKRRGNKSVCTVFVPKAIYLRSSEVFLLGHEVSHCFECNNHK